MRAFGLPGASPGPTIAFEILAGLAPLLGIGPRQAVLLLSGFSVATALVFHRGLGDQIQQIMFLKNVAIAGGLLLLIIPRLQYRGIRDALFPSAF